MPATPRAVVLDAWPILERYTGHEPSATEVDVLLSSSDTPAIMNMVNFSEVHSSLLRDRGQEAAELDTLWLRQLLVLEPITPELASAVARIKCAYYMSLGDAFAAATAIIHRAPLWTGDAELLCEDRTWDTRDLRDADRQQQHAERLDAGKLQVGRRARVLPRLDRRQLADYIISPPALAPAATAVTEPLDIA